jgi:predicted TIM-barrel fold metal-dependent hydrolase
MIVAMHTHYEPDKADFEAGFLAGLDESGVDHAAMMGNCLTNDVNEIVMRIAQAHPDRITGVVYLDPRRPDAPTTLQHYFEQGMRALKLIPGIGYYPNEECVYPVYAKAAELGIPAMVHVGSISGIEGCRAKYHQAMMLDDVAADFPELVVVIVHAGLPRIEEVLMIVGRQNIMIEETAQQGTMPIFVDRLERLLDRYGPQRIMFGGSDHHIASMPRALDRMNSALQTLQVAEEDRRLILGLNARDLLGLGGGLERQRV